jgi:hypothetical protein
MRWIQGSKTRIERRETALCRKARCLDSVMDALYVDKGIVRDVHEILSLNSVNVGE